MNTIYTLYDSDTCEVIRAYHSMDKAMTAAINRLLIFSHICTSISVDEEYTVIEYRHHDTGALCALSIQMVDIEGE